MELADRDSEWPLFPKRRRMTDVEIEANRIIVSMSPILSELSGLVFERWKSDPSLWSVSAALNVAGMSVAGRIPRLGRFALYRLQPYWLRRELLDVEGVAALRKQENTRINELLDQALALDAELRTQCPGPGREAGRLTA